MFYQKPQLIPDTCTYGFALIFDLCSFAPILVECCDRNYPKCRIHSNVFLLCGCFSLCTCMHACMGSARRLVCVCIRPQNLNVVFYFSPVRSIHSDTDECAISNGNCSQLCVNSNGRWAGARKLNHSRSWA